MGIVDDTMEDGVGDGGFADHGVPGRHGKLGGYQRRFAAVSSSSRIFCDTTHNYKPVLIASLFNCVRRHYTEVIPQEGNSTTIQRKPIVAGRHADTSPRLDYLGRGPDTVYLAITYLSSLELSTSDGGIHPARSTIATTHRNRDPTETHDHERPNRWFGHTAGE
jgi:hypothetical protein